MNEIEQIKALLWEQWDPIGVNDYSEWTDEYDAYAKHILKMLNQDADEKKIASYLERCALEHIGVQRSDNHDIIAQLIMKVRRGADV